MNKTIRQEYDCIISSGGCCNAANQLKLRGLRPVSFPFDWPLTRDDRPIRYLPKGLRNRFRDFIVDNVDVPDKKITLPHDGIYGTHILSNVVGSNREYVRQYWMWDFVHQTQKHWCNLWKNVTWISYLKYLLKTPYRSEAFRFIWGHIKGLVFFAHTKNRQKRYLICGIRVWKKRIERKGKRQRTIPYIQGRNIRDA